MSVAIVGGGPAGCAAAFYLKRVGIDSTVYEQGELGGACRTHYYENIPYEFGPQILYTELNDIKKDFQLFIDAVPPPTHDSEYHPKVSIDGKINDCHDFPLTLQNVLKLDNPQQVINELYKVDLNSPDFSSLENYLISRVGKTLYETYMKNYNIKQWKINPSEMDAQWASTRTLTLRERPDMFRGKWQGHPGNYNPLWEGLTKDSEICYKKVDVTIDDSGFVNDYLVDGESLCKNHDIVISTVSPNQQLPSINFCIIYVVLKSDEFLMPSYATSFPNNYSFVRIMEYKQQYFVESEYTILDFEFPWTEASGNYIDKWIDEVKDFAQKNFSSDIVELFVKHSYRTYPLINSKSLSMLSSTFNKLSHTNIIPLGRAGIHSYISKDTCLFMAKVLSSKVSEYPNMDPTSKIALFKKLRERLS